MVPKQPTPDHNQGVLLDVNRPNNDTRRQTIEVIENPDLHVTAQVDMLHADERTAALTDRRQHAAQLLVALTHIGLRKRASGHVKHDSTSEGNAEFNRRYNGSADIVRAEQEFRIPTAQARAFNAFSTAYKLGLTAGDEAISAHDVYDEFVQFNHKFSDKTKRAKFRAQLRRTVKLADESEAAVALPDTYTVDVKPEVAHTPEEELELLNSRQRLIAIRDDDRAGFLPANHHQKTLAFTMLTFLDHPDKHPGGVYEYLRVIADHQIKVFKAKGALYGEAKLEGRRAVTSIMHEMADHIVDAQRSIVNLQQAKAVLDESPNPAITVAEALEDNPQIEAGFDEFMRYRDLMRLRETGEAPMPFDPLGPKRNEGAEVVRDGQNKRLDDPYTGTVRPDAAAEYVEEQHQTTRVITARQQLPGVIENEHKKLDFFVRVMNDIRAPYKNEAQAILAAVRTDTAA